MMSILIEKTIEVQFYGPYRFGGSESESVFLAPIGKLKGIYLWAIPFENEFLVYYVGETGISFANRLMEHLQKYLHGEYSFFEPREFAEGKKVQLWRGMWKDRKGNPKAIHEFIESYPKLNQKLLMFINQMCFFLAPLEVDHRLRQRIEGAIGKRLYAQPGMVGDFQDKGVHYFIRRPQEAPVKVLLRFSKPMLGLVPEMTV